MQRRSGFPLVGIALLLLGTPASSTAHAGAAGNLQPQRGRPTLSLTFDDSHADHRWAADALSRRGMVGTFFVNSPRIENQGYLRAEDLHHIEGGGHEIGGHTLHHPNLSKLDEAAQLREICDDRANLLSLGLSVRAFAYPFNGHSPTAMAVVERCGYVSARAAAGILAPGSCKGCPSAEAIPPKERYRIRSFPSYQEWMGIETLQAAIEAAAAGEWLVLVFHDFCDDQDCASPYAIQRSEFVELLDWIDARGIRTSTLSEMAPGPLLPPLRGPAVELPEPVGKNLLRNPGLRGDGDGNGLPDCWMEGGFGDRAGSLVHHRKGETSFTRIVVHEWDSGDHKLLSARGPCAPEVQGGQRFRGAVRHRTQGHARMVAYYRDSAGAWQWWANSPPLPQRTDWDWTSWETPALPEAATAIQFGLSLRSEGYVDASYLSLEPTEAELPLPSCGSAPLGWLLFGLAGRRISQWGRRRPVRRSSRGSRSVVGATSTGR